jgi:hypothetical protein
MSPSMAFARCGPTHGVVVHTAAPPSDAEWQAYLQETERWFGPLIGCLVVTAGGGPNGAQRRALAEMFARHGPVVVRTAVMMDSVVVRTIVNAINLFNPQIQAFRGDALDAALQHIRGVAHREALLATLAELRRQLAAAG